MCGAYGRVRVSVKRWEGFRLLRSDALNMECHGFELDFMPFLLHMAALKHSHITWSLNLNQAYNLIMIRKSEVYTSSWLKNWTCGVLKCVTPHWNLCVVSWFLFLSEQRRRGSMYLEEETGKKSEMISCIFSLKEEVGALAKALRLFEVNFSTNSWHTHTVTLDQVPDASPDLHVVFV